MLLAIISDIHGNLANLAKALETIKKEKPDIMLVCGDLQDPEAINLIGAANIKTHIVFGNADFAIEDLLRKGAKKFSYIKIHGDLGELVLKNKKIAFCHFYSEAKKIAATRNYDIVFAGHRHSPWEEKIGNTILIRPGNIAGLYYNPTFCFYDLEKMKARLVLLNKSYKNY